MDNFIKSMPKIELHCHLDGSMNLESTRRLLMEIGETYSLEQLRELLEAPQDCESLAEYLKRFDLPIRCIQTKGGLKQSAKCVALDAAEENIKYIEVRFAPSFSTAEGLSIREIVESVQEGLKEAEQEADIQTGIIVCGMRNLDMDTNLKMLRESAELLGAGVVACDLAGDEKAYPTKDFAEFFESAKKMRIPFTIHSGECGSTENIKAALELGAKRLGHGIAMRHDLKLMEACASQKVGVELCPTSNLQTKALTDFNDYPIRSFMAAGVPISINTDNRTVSGTTSTAELEKVIRRFALTKEELHNIYTQSVEMSFASDDTKHKLLSYW
uniref:adenosine deaminase n=1 Tax=Agathobacter sp. TaxID=2021311 RepID=UPI0040563F3C